MNNYIVACLFGLLLPICSWGQGQKKRNLEIGIQAGPSHTFLRGNEHSTTSRNSFRSAAGIFVRYQLPKMSLRAEVLYENKGNSENGLLKMYDADDNVQEEEAYTLRQHFHYLKLPVLLEIPFGKSGWYISFGPYLGYLLEQQTRAFGEDIDLTSQYRKVDAGLTGGIAYYRPLSSSFTFKAEARHNLGMLNVNTEETSPVKTASTNLFLGLSYRL